MEQAHHDSEVIVRLNSGGRLCRRSQSSRLVSRLQAGRFAGLRLLTKIEETSLRG